MKTDQEYLKKYLRAWGCGWECECPWRGPASPLQQKKARIRQTIQA